MPAPPSSQSNLRSYSALPLYWFNGKSALHVSANRRFTLNQYKSPAQMRGVDGGVKTEENRRFESIVVPANEKTAIFRWRLVFGISVLSVFRLVLVFHPIAWAFDQDGFCMMEESIQHGRGDGAVVIENGGPLFEWLVGG